MGSSLAEKTEGPGHGVRALNRNSVPLLYTFFKWEYYCEQHNQSLSKAI